MRDRGFSMLEIVAAIVVLGVVMAAAAPQMISSIRASSNAKMVSRAKGVVQGQLDSMRTMPFRVTPSAGDHRDLLDTYYRNRAAGTAPSCGTAAAANQPLPSWSGYVSPSNTARCPYEPQTGAMYRKVLAGGTGEVPAGYTVVLNTQFISAGTTPTVVDVATGFDSQTAGRDGPPSQQVGVTATVLYSAYGRWTPITVYTQIASRTTAEARIRLDARGTAVEMGTEELDVATGVSQALTLTGGQINLTGSLANTSQAKASLTAMTAATASARRSGAALAVDAPYTNPVTLNAGAEDLGIGCSATCWGATLLPPFTVAADDGLPRAGTGGGSGLQGPLQTSLPDVVTRNGFEFDVDDVHLPGGLRDEVVSMDATQTDDHVTNQASGLFHCAFNLVAPESHLTGAGYLDSGDEFSAVNPRSVEACGGSRSNVIRLLRTSKAPDGLVRVSVKSSARCTVTGAAHVPETNHDYRAEVAYFEWTPAVYDPGTFILTPGYGRYVSAGTITPATTADPLASVPLASTKVSDTETLATYIDSWSGLTADRVVRTAAAQVAEVAIPALFTLQTKPIATAPQTALSFSAGAASCRAEDRR